MVRRGLQLPPPRELAERPEEFPAIGPHSDCTEAQRLLYLRLIATLRAVEQARQERGWSWVTVARMVGITDRALRNLRTGRSWPDLPTFVILEAYLAPDELDSLDPATETRLPEQIVALVGTDISPNTREVELELLKVAADEVLPSQSEARLLNCPLCDLVDQDGLGHACPQHGGHQQEADCWVLIEARWQYQLELGAPGAARGMERMRELRELADRYAQPGASGQRVDTAVECLEPRDQPSLL